MNTDLLDAVLSLEDRYYRQGFAQGHAEGSYAGKLEGRATGLETGFDKFTKFGMLAGKGAVWAGRVSARSQTGEGSPSLEDLSLEDVAASKSKSKSKIGISHENESMLRLLRKIETLRALTDAETLSTVNDENACTDFEDRLKRATAKARLIENVIGDKGALKEKEAKSKVHAAAGVEEPNSTFVKRIRARDGDEGNIEDIGRV